MVWRVDAAFDLSYLLRFCLLVRLRDMLFARKKQLLEVVISLLQRGVLGTVLIKIVFIRKVVYCGFSIV